MGIKFLCPNGHKLNVKSFLSGKKAICPKCGVKVLVPNDPSLAEPAAGQVGAAGAGTLPNSPGDDAGQLGTFDVPASTDEQSVVGAGIDAAAPFPASSAQPGTVRDAIDEAPTAVWYVRPPSGGQFGPAAADMMRTWLADGRVTANSLVWRSGWPQWLSAQTAFPQLAGSPVAAPLPQGATSPMYPAVTAYPQAPAMAPVASPMMGAPYGTAAVPLGQVPLGQVVSAAPLSGFPIAGEEAITRRRRRRKSNDTTVIVSGILIVLTLVLVIILVIVLTRDDIPSGDTAPAKIENRSKKTALPPAPTKPKSTEEEI